MYIATVSKIQTNTRAWVHKAPFLALILAIAAFGPLMSFDSVQQQTTLEAQTLISLHGAGIKVFGVALGAIYVALGLAFAFVPPITAGGLILGVAFATLGISAIVLFVTAKSKIVYSEIE